MNNSFLFVCILEVVVSLILSFGLAVFWGVKTKSDILTFITGAFCFVIFAMFLEGIAHAFCLNIPNPVSNFINSNKIAYVIYAALAAALFEETGRLVGFNFLKKKFDRSETSIAYGIGHGGVEVILSVGVTYFVYLVLYVLASFNKLGSQASIIMSISNQISFSLALIAIFERCYALMLHISLSVVVYYGVKNHKIGYYLLTIGFHFLADLPAAIYHIHPLNIVFVEGLGVAISVGVAIFAYKLYKKA